MKMKIIFIFLVDLDRRRCCILLRKGPVNSVMKPIKDHSFIRGVCRNSRAGTEEYLREIGYARSIGVS